MLFKFPNFTDIFLLFLIWFHICPEGEVSHYWKLGWGHTDSSNFTSRRIRSPAGDLQGWCSVIEHRWCSAHSVFLWKTSCPWQVCEAFKAVTFVAHEWPQIWPILIENWTLKNAYYSTLLKAHNFYLDAKGWVCVHVWFMQSSVCGQKLIMSAWALTEAGRILDLPH